MQRVVNHELPDGTIRQVHPFHISMEGLETAVLCRDEADYDAMVKILCVASRRKNVVIIIYAVVSNHGHVAVLAERRQDAEAYGQEVKRMYAMWLRRKYGESAVLRGTDVKAILLDGVPGHVPERSPAGARKARSRFDQTRQGKDHAHGG